jgi:post-segregation antitoxin (ccd killing protein)
MTFSARALKIPRGKHHNKTASKITISLYISKKLLEKARNHLLNLARITEQALSSILDYMEAQNIARSSFSNNNGSFPKKVKWTGRDLNPRLPPCEGGDHTRLVYRPILE